MVFYAIMTGNNGKLKRKSRMKQVFAPRGLKSVVFSRNRFLSITAKCGFFS